MGLSWNVVFHRNAVKQLELLRRAGLDGKARAIALILEADPFQNPPPYEKLQGDLKDCYSRRINIRHKMVYTVDRETMTVKVLSMWSHYGDN